MPTPMQLLALTDPAVVSYWPFAVLALSVTFIILAITVLRMHAFLALVLAALLAGWLSHQGTMPEEITEEEWKVFEQVQALQPCSAEAVHRALTGVAWTDKGTARLIRSLKEKGLLAGQTSPQGTVYWVAVAYPTAKGFTSTQHGVAVLATAAAAFGKTAGGIGIVIALASIIGMALMESGAADQVVRRFIRFFGEKRAGVALLVSGFILSVPVFFDTVFFLMVPLARALAARTGKNFMFYVLAICGGGALTHSIVPPTPGPLLVAEFMKLDLGVAIVAGLLAGLAPAVGIYYLSKWLALRVPVPLREVAGASMADLNKIASRKEEELPPFWLSILPVVMPVLFIALASFLGAAKQSFPGLVDVLGGPASFATLQRVAGFFGDKTFALLLGAVVALGIYFVHGRMSLRQIGEKLGPPLETAGLIILITSAGGAFGTMIRFAGVGDAIEALSEGRMISYILLAWLITAVVRVAQGSATVSMITGSALMTAIIAGKDLPYHPLYIYLAIGFGSMILSWMNDSGFWVVGKLSGFTEKETLKSWTVVVSALSIMGLVEVLILSKLLPLVKTAAPLAAG